MPNHPHSGYSHADFTALVDRYQARLHGFLLGLLAGPEHAFDLVQDTFSEAWQMAQRGDAPFAPGAEEVERQRWLFRAAYNNAMTLLRRKRLIRWESLDALGDPLAPITSAFEEHVIEGAALHAALAQLAPQDVACLLLRIVYGFSAAETGNILHLSADNINTRLARAKQRLRAAYLTHTDQGERIRP